MTASSVLSKTVSVAGDCGVTVSVLPATDLQPKLPGPGELFRNLLGWTTPLHTESSTVWLLFWGGLARGAASCCSCVFGRLGCTGHLPHSMGGTPALPLLMIVWWWFSSWAANQRALLGVAPRFVEGRCTPAGALVFRKGSANKRDLLSLRELGVACTVA